MTRAIIDASVIVKTVVDQPFTANARTVIRSFDLSAPSLLKAETANALVKYVRLGSSTRAAAIKALETIGSHAIDFHPIDETATRESLDIALSISHSIYDCYYLTLSRRLTAPFITADLKLLRKAAAANFEVINLADIPESAP